MGERDYWDLATERIDAAGIPPQRAGAVRCLEVIITASPEWFERGLDGRPVDYSQNAWLRSTRTFLIEKFGEQNLVAFQIRQGDKSPYVHAVIVPVTAYAQLSARDLFNPVNLRGYQSQYAEKMKAHGLGRGSRWDPPRNCIFCNPCAPRKCTPYSRPMAYAIMRHGKITSKAQAAQASAHNYRQYEVPNVDPLAPHPNIEFVNAGERDYWEVAEERIEDAGITIRRKDAVRCVEIILTASPEFFDRDANGRAVDMSDSQWLKDTKAYLVETFGEKNLVGFQLQQDEKSPHVHAMVVPITADGRLSARDVFNLGTLRGYQTGYAATMKAHGLERGVEHSQAEHQPMKRFYGQQSQTAAEMGTQLGPVGAYQDVQVKRPERKDLFSLSEWEAKTTAQVNKQARAQVEAANQRAEKAQNLALENAAAKDQVRVLQKQLSTSEGLKEDHKAQSDEIAKRIAGGENPPAKWVTRGDKLLDEAIGQLRDGRAAVATFQGWAEEAKWRGDYQGGAEQRNGLIKEQEAKNKALEADLSRYAGGRTRLAELNEQRDKVTAKKVRQAEEHAQWVKEAPAREAQRQREQEQQEKMAYEGEKLKIEQISGEILQTKSYIMSLKWFAVAAREGGLQVEIPSEGQLILSVSGSKNRFEHQDLQLGGKEFADVLNRQMTVNKDQHDREKGLGNDRGRD